MRLKLAGGMCPRVATSHSSDPRYRNIDFQCVACRAAGMPASKTRDTVDHILLCKFYTVHKDGLQLDTDIGLVSFLRKPSP